MVQTIGRAHTGNQRGRLMGRERNSKKWPLKGIRMEGGIKRNITFLVWVELGAQFKNQRPGKAMTINRRGG
jgi:hypothetical protein